MTTVLYAVYDEGSGEVVHVHAVAGGAEPSPEEVLALAGLGGRERLAVVELPTEGPATAVRVVDGQVQQAGESAAHGGAGVALHEGAPEQRRTAARQRSFRRDAGA